MLPLNDTEPNRYSFFPFVTVFLILVNCFTFYAELVLISQDGFWPFLMRYGFTPALILGMQGAGV